MLQHPREMLGRALPVLVVAVLLLVLMTGLLWALQRRLVFLPDAAPVPAAARVLPGARDVVLRTDDGLALGGWYLPAARPGAPAVLVANGNAGSRALRAPLARALAGRGLSVLLFDYRGYGGNPGAPSEQGLARDVRAARRVLVEQEGVPPDRLLYLGESLGAAVVAELATEHPPAGLVLRSPFVDLAAVGAVHYPFLPVRALLRDEFPVARHVARVQAPTTVVYGGGDRIVPPDQSRAVAARAARLEQLVEVPGADHNDLPLVAGPAVADAVSALARRTAPPGDS
jgi:pimeloyl-ACP methyl ester carboxylesterase